MNNTLITGGAGFIGSHAIDLFLERGYNVTCIDKFTYAANRLNIQRALKHKNFQLIYADICNFSDVREVCLGNNISWIVNFAAETHVDNSIKNCDEFIRTNFLGVKNLLEVCKLKRNMKLFHVSTDEVYGTASTGFFTESSILNPRNPYSATKAAAEHLIHSYNNTYGIDYLIVRPSNNFGPRQHREKFIPTVLRSIFKDEKIPVYGAGQNVRDWLFVKDNVSMIEKLLASGAINDTFNICAENYLTNIELVKLILDFYNKDFDASVSFVEDRAGHDFRYAISCDKLRALGIYEKSDFKNNLQETISWYNLIKEKLVEQ